MRVRQVMSDTTNSNNYSNHKNNTNAHTGTRRASSKPEHQRTLEYDGAIIYPDVGLNTTCIHGLCENVIGYPKERIMRLLSRSKFPSDFLVDESVEVNINTRLNTEEYLCETRSQTLYPEKAKNINKVEKTIVNVEGSKQGIAVETCITNGECKYSKGFPEEFTSYCQQKYIHKKLMILGENDNFVLDSFEVPSCCVCTLKKK